jgi:hypothetical protein
LEVGHINSVSIRLDQTNQEHSLTLDSLFIMHNAIVYQFDLRYIILNKGQAKKEFIPLSHPKLVNEKVCYYIATHTADKILSRTNVHFKVVVTGSKGMIGKMNRLKKIIRNVFFLLGPIELKESLTNGENPFEKECIDLFHIEDDDIGDPISITITLEPKGYLEKKRKYFTNFDPLIYLDIMSHLFNGAKCER